MTSLFSKEGRSFRLRTQSVTLTIFNTARPLLLDRNLWRWDFMHLWTRCEGRRYCAKTILPKWQVWAPDFYSTKQV